MTTVTIFISGWKVDIEKYCKINGFKHPKNIEEFEAYDIPKFEDTRMDLIVVSRSYDSVDFEDYGIYIGFSWVDMNKSFGLLTQEKMKYLSHMIDGAKVIGTIKKPEYCIETKTGIWIDSYDQDRMFKVNGERIY